uniref:Uncharacterized protein n=1 Tax=Stegastes partitus TaxID=144197 RepID=A0A3B5ATF1_9TELE
CSTSQFRPACSLLLQLFHKNHIFKSFLGVVSVSLAVVETALTLTVTTIHIILLGLQLTRYHVCLLLQILGYRYRLLQSAGVLVTGFCTVTQRLQAATFRAKWIVYSFVTDSLWCLAALYVFLLSDLIPVLDDVSHHRIRCVPQLSLNNPPPKDQITAESQTHIRRSFVHQVLRIFLNTWTLFLFFLAMLLLLPVRIPSYLDLNIAWLCFLNSLLIAVVLCAVWPASQLSQGLASVPPDSFCEWRFNFSLALRKWLLKLHPFLHPGFLTVITWLLYKDCGQLHLISTST